MPSFSNMIPKRNRSSGLDFSDGQAPLASNAAAMGRSLVPPTLANSYLPYDLDEKESTISRSNSSRNVQVNRGMEKDPEGAKMGAVHLNRTKTDRRRLQGLMKGDGDGSIIDVDSKSSVQPVLVGWAKFNAWMVNEGSRRIFMAVWLLLHLLVFSLGFVHYQLKDNLQNARDTFSYGFTFARSAALVLHVDVAFILLPVCRNFISILRRGPLNAIVPFEKNITFHKQVAWSIVFFTIVHTVAHMVNFTVLAVKTKTGIVGFIGANFLTGPGATGWIMNAALGVMVYYAMEKRRRAPNGGFEKFWYSHHLFIVFFANWQLHGMFCMIKPDRPPFCSPNTIGVFWRYWIVGGAIFIYERVLREVRARHKTYISKVIQHPGKVVEVQIKKERTTTKAGQYIFINCPEISYFQWHPFTLTSAPEEDYISVHISCKGDFTTAFAKALGCDWNTKGKDEKNKGAQAPPINKVLPRVMVDGPFGSASEDVFKFEVSVLVGAGIGVTPFASILKSIWYRANYPQGKPTRLRKVYFFWICGDYAAFEWFQSLLMAIEGQDLENYIEIHTYLTKVKPDDITNIVVQDVGGERDAITGLRAPTHYGRPNWDRIFQSIRDKHTATDAGVFFCGPKGLGSTLHQMCNKWTSPGEDGTRFFWGKENF